MKTYVKASFDATILQYADMIIIMIMIIIMTFITHYKIQLLS